MAQFSEGDRLLVQYSDDAVAELWQERLLAGQVSPLLDHVKATVEEDALILKNFREAREEREQWRSGKYGSVHGRARPLL